MTATIDAAASEVLPDRVLVQRAWDPIKTGRNRIRYGFTLHHADCPRITGDTVAKLPAPAVAYDDTVDCAQCRPHDPHRYRFTEVDGAVRGTCTHCDITVSSPGMRGCQANMNRAHAGARAREEMAAALARGPVTRVIVPLNRGPAWRLHRATCAFLARVMVIYPIVSGADIPASTVACDYCVPLGAPSRGEPVALRPRLKARPGQVNRDETDSGEHQQTRQRGDGGQLRLSCSCGADSGLRPSPEAARSALRREHLRRQSQHRKARTA